jgi:hypothetical protein
MKSRNNMTIVGLVIIAIVLTGTLTAIGTQPMQIKQKELPEIDISEVQPQKQVYLSSPCPCSSFYPTIELLEETESYEPELLFFTANSNADFNPWAVSELGIKDKIWLDDTTLLVKVHVSINCVRRVEDGSILIEGNKITLKYNVVGPKGKLANCICGKTLYFLITNLTLPEFYYTFELERILTLQ